MKSARSKIIPASWELPMVFHKRLGHEAGRQRAMVHEDHLLLILHDLPEPGIPERNALLFWRSPQGGWRSTESGGGLPGLKGLLERYAVRLDELEDRLADASEAKPLFDVMRSASPIRRALSNLQAALQQAREQVEDKELIAMRDRAYDLLRAAELLMEETRHAMEYDLARIEEQQARTANKLARSGHQLNLLAALFFPLTAIASIFGMNMQSGLESSGPWLFWGTLAAGLLVGLLLRSRIDQRQS